MKKPSNMPDDNPNESKLEVAIKIFNLKDTSHALWIRNCLKSEMFIAKYLKHPNIVQTFEVLKTHSHGYIVMAFATNGSIQMDIYQRLKRPYYHEVAKKYFRYLMTGLQYMHSLNVSHRDLKLDNFLLTAEWLPMISDFGFAARGSNQTKIVLTHMLRKTCCGTKGYMAPELHHIIYSSSSTIDEGNNSKVSSIEKYYDAKAVDIYAMGVSLFEMFNMKKPYSKKMDLDTMRKIRNKEITWENQKMENICKELIYSMLSYNPEDRPNAEEVLKNRWLTRNTVINSLIDKMGM